MNLDKLRASLFRAQDQLVGCFDKQTRQRLRTAIRTLEAQIVREKRLNSPQISPGATIYTTTESRAS